MRADVAIIGCGPVGGVAANLLARAGLSVVVVEVRADPYPLPRAVHLDHEMMRVFQAAGLADALAPMMRATQGHVHIGADGGVIRYLGNAGQARRFGWANDYFFYQPELEAALRDGLARFPHVRLLLGAAVSDVVEQANDVRLSLDDGSDITAGHVIACDGASSGVRRALDIALDDLGFDEPWLVVDAEVDGPLRFPAYPALPADADLQQLSVMLCDPARPTTVVPGRGNHRRWEFMLLPGEGEEMRAPEVAARLIAPWVAGAPHHIVRAATYRFHALVAEQWRAGRVFLAGDAAHQTPPFFGQGMCHGIRDVANLAWKLALVIRGNAAPTLLDGYQAEREPQVRSVISAAIDAGRYICELDPAAAALRDRSLRAGGADRAGRTAADLVAPLTAGVRLGSARAGERFIQPLVRARDGRVALLDDVTGGGLQLLTREAVPFSPDFARLGGRIAQIGGDLIDEQGALNAWLDAAGANAVALRPDGYVFGTAPAGGAQTLLRDWLAALHLCNNET